MFQHYYFRFNRVGSLFFIFSLIFFHSNKLNATCTEANSIGLQVGNQGLKIGQSFTMDLCASGNFTSITVMSATNTSGDEPNNITLEIRQGSGYGGTLIHTQNDFSFGIGSETVTLSSAVAFISGQTYTFSFEVTSGNFNLNRNSTGTDIYSGGTLFDASGSAIANDDLLFTVNTDALVLPVELTHFDVNKTKNDVSLDWQTASEYENLGFEIERSANSKDWEYIGFVEGRGTSHSIQNYHFIDSNPESGNNYYRLKQIDYDGRADYSDVKNIFFDSKNDWNNFKVFPNPANGNEVLTIQNLTESVEEIIVMDYTGRMVLKQPISDSIGQITLSNNFSPGVYSIIAKSIRKTSTQKLIIQ